MARPRRQCVVHRNRNNNNNDDDDDNNNNNLNPVENVCHFVEPSNPNKTWLQSSLTIFIIALILFQMYFTYRFSTQQQKLENIEGYSTQTRRGLWEVSREQRRLVEHLEDVHLKLLELKDRLKGMEDRELNVDVGEIDYALDGRVLSVGSVENEKNLTSVNGRLDCCNTVSRPPQTILTPSHLPGDCWSVEIENAIATIELTAEIYVKGITLEHLHASKSSSGKTTSAPKFFSMWGVKPNKETDCLGSFEYDAQGPAVQTFPAKDHTTTAYKVVKLQVFTNHGNPEYTCIYRVRVHGVPSSSDENNLQQKRK